MKIVQLVFYSCMLVFIVGCGGGSSGSPALAPSGNSVPTVDAGVDQSVVQGTNVTLSATAADSDGTIDLCEWWEGSTKLSDEASFSKADFSVGVHTIICTVMDDYGSMVSDTVTVTVTASVNQAPVAEDKTILLDENTQKIVLLTGSDSDGDELTFVQLSSPSHGVLNGSLPNLTYEPNTNYYGEDSFTYKVNDGVQDSVVATVSIVVKNICKLLLKTGQMDIYKDGDDGDYQKGKDRLLGRDHSKEVVIDSSTGLMWQDNETVSKRWLTMENYSNGSSSPSYYHNTSGDTAATYCSQLILGGHRDWRLPDINALKTIRDFGQIGRAIGAKFENVGASHYWSSTSYGDARMARYVRFSNGMSSFIDKRSGGYVRCVRNHE